MEKKERIELSNRLILEFGATGDNDTTSISCKLDKLLDILEQELDKAREEGKREAFTKDEWFMLKLAMNDIFNSGNSAYEGISEKIKGYLN